MSCVQIAKVPFLDDDTVRSWHKQYLAEDWEAVAYDGWKGGQSRMTTAQEGNLSAWLEERFCRSTVQIRAYMSSEFNNGYSHSGCIKLLARLGFEYRKPKTLPRVSDVEKQAAFIAFYENLLNNCLPTRPSTSRMPFIRTIKVNPAMVGPAKGQIQLFTRHLGVGA